MSGGGEGETVDRAQHNAAHVPPSTRKHRQRELRTAERRAKERAATKESEREAQQDGLPLSPPVAVTLSPSDPSHRTATTTTKIGERESGSPSSAHSLAELFFFFRSSKCGN